MVGFEALRAWLTDEARMTQVPAEPPRENRVNQSGSVALSTEAMRGPPWRNSLIIMALLTRDYEPGGRGFKSCRARQNSRTWQRKPSPPSCCGTVVGPLIHWSAWPRLNSSTWPAKPGPPCLLWDPVGTLSNTSPLAVGDAYQGPCTGPVEKQIRLLEQAAHIGTRIMTGHRMIGMAKECFAIFGGNARRSQPTRE